jgi:dipeptidase E
MNGVFLGGGGDEHQSFKLDAIFARRIKGRALLYLPIAQIGGQDLFKGCFQWFLKMMNSHGIAANNITMWTSLEGKSAQDFLNFKGIYIGGGNTGHLCRCMRESSFPEVVNSFIAEDRVIYGGSAGAIVLGQSLYGVPEEVEGTGEECFDGLGVVPGYSFRCHYDKEEATIAVIKRALAKGVSRMAAIPETSGLMSTNDGLCVVGSEPVVVFMKDGQCGFWPGELLPFC